MILFDTSVILDALYEDAAHFDWATRLIVESASTVGAAVNAVTVAELCAGDRHPDRVEADLRNWGVKILDVPAAAASVCGQAHRRYTLARRFGRRECAENSITGFFHRRPRGNHALETGFARRRTDCQVFSQNSAFDAEENFVGVNVTRLKFSSQRLLTSSPTK